MWGWRHQTLNGYLTPKPLIRTWGCRISLDSEWCEKFKNIYVDKTRYENFRSTGENSPYGPTRGQFPTLPTNPLILGKNMAYDIWLCPIFFCLKHWKQLQSHLSHWGQDMSPWTPKYLKKQPKWVIFIKKNTVSFWFLTIVCSLWPIILLQIVSSKWINAGKCN